MWINARVHSRLEAACHSSLDWVFPRTCVGCGCLLGGSELSFTCDSCRLRYSFIREPICCCCGRPFFGKLVDSALCLACKQSPPRFLQARSLFLYRGIGARVVHALKYEQGTFLRKEIIALLKGKQSWASYFGRAQLVPVPLHPRKLRSRGYNQAGIVAQAVKEACPETNLQPCLKRIRMTPSQTLLTRKDRLRNMQGAFDCPISLDPEGLVMLIDDVLTTGATLNAAADAIIQAGCPHVYSFTLAHG